MHKRSSLVFFIFLLAFVFRIVIATHGHHEDLFSNASWGEWIYFNGFRDFYQNKIWVYSPPTQFPLVNIIYYCNFLFYRKLVDIFSLINTFFSNHNFFPPLFSYWFRFFNWFAWTYFSETPFMNGFLFVMKLLPIFSDIMIGFIIFRILKRKGDMKRPIFFTSLFLFSPFSWYISSLWGQYDSVAALFLVVSFCLVSSSLSASGNKKTFKLLFSSLFFLLSFMIKPYVIFSLPIYVLVYLRSRPSLAHFFYSFISCLSLSWLLTLPFSGFGNAFSYTKDAILPVVFGSDRKLLGGHNFSFWRIFLKAGNINTFSARLILPVAFWSFAIIGLSYLYAFLRLKRKGLSYESVFLSLFVVFGVFFFFGTNVLERYFYPGVLFLFLFTISRGLNWHFWLVLSLIFFFNLFISWGYPFINRSLINIFWNNGYLVSIISLISVTIFLLILRKVTSLS
jgi:hypothetical protein